MVQRTVNKTISYELTIATQKMGYKPRRQGSTGFQVKIDVIAGSTGRQTLEPGAQSRAQLYKRGLDKWKRDWNTAR